MNKRLLIAGYGFLGVAVREVFAAAGWQVTALSRRGEGAALRCDLTSADEVAAVAGEFDLIIHCASSGGGSVDAYRAVYLEGCENLVRRFSGTPVIFTSSSSVYPQVDHAVVTEASATEPSSPRASILREAEEVVLASGGNVARLTGLYGEGRCHVLKNFLAGTARLDGGGERVMNFIHRRDAAEGLLIIASSGLRGEVFNINGGYQSQRDVYQSIADYYGMALPPVAEADVPRKRGNTSKKVSSEKMVALGWRPHFTDFLMLAHACLVEE